MRLKRIFSGLAPALAIAALVGFAAPGASYAQNAPATTEAPLRRQPLRPPRPRQFLRPSPHRRRRRLAPRPSPRFLKPINSRPFRPFRPS